MANAIRCLLELVPTVIFLLINNWPGTLGNHLRYRYYKRRLKHLGLGSTLDVGIHMVNPSYISIGDHSHIDRYVTLVAGPPHEGGRKIHHKPNAAYEYKTGEIHVGDRVHIAPFAYLVGHGGISVGERSGIASGARLYSLSHHYRNLNDPEDKSLYVFSPFVPMEEQAMIIGPVVMEKNTALGLNAVILPGATISENSWVGVLSTVVGTIPPDVVASGSPATVSGQRR